MQNQLKGVFRNFQPYKIWKGIQTRFVFWMCVGQLHHIHLDKQLKKGWILKFMKKKPNCNFNSLCGVSFNTVKIKWMGWHIHDISIYYIKVKKSVCCKKKEGRGKAVPHSEPNPRCYVPVIFTEHGVLCGIRMIPTDSSTNRR